MDLEENALDSTRRAVESLVSQQSPADLKVGILHIFHAVELLLKARLAKEHRVLVFQRVEEANDRAARTVSFGIAIKRLAAVGVELSKRDWDDLKQIQLRRNEFQHYRVDIDIESAEHWLGRGLRFVIGFLDREFDTQLTEELSEEAYQALERTIYNYEERLVKATERIPEWHPRNAPDVSIAICPSCGEETLPVGAVETAGRPRCEFCFERFYFASCPKCGEPIFSDEMFTEENDPGICEDCWAYVRNL